MSDIINTDRHDAEFEEMENSWDEEGRLPETGNTDDELAHLERIISRTPEDKKQEVVDLIAARTFLARENNNLTDEICSRVLKVLGVENSEESKRRLLKLVQSA